MPSNLAIDDKLLLEAQKISGLKTKKETVSIALKEFIQRREQEKIIGHFGTIDYGSYDYKRLRSKK